MKSLKQRFSKLFENIMLSDKLLLCFILIGIIPIFVCGAIIYNYINKNAMNEEIYKAREKTIAVRNSLNSKMENLSNIALAIISMQNIESYMIDEIPHSPESILSFKQGSYTELRRIRDNFNSFGSLRLISFNEQIEEILPMIVGREKLGSPIVEHEIEYNRINTIITFDGNQTLNLVISDKMPGNVVYYYNRKYFSGASKYVIEITVPMNIFFDEIKKYSDHKIIIIDGDVILCDNHDILDQASMPLETLHDKIKSENLLAGTIDIDGKKYIVTNERIRIGSFSKIFYVHSMDRVTRQINNFRNAILAAVMISLLVFSLLDKKIITFLFKRMDIVLGAMKCVENGDVAHIITISGNDEVSILADGFNKMTKKMNEYIDIILKKQMATKDSEIKALLSQIDSHFIYNTLDAVKTQAEKIFDYDVADSLTSLAKIMRYNTDWSNKYVLLNEELLYIKEYVALMNLRFGGTIKYKTSVESNALDVKILKMLIQPLVENAILHGLFAKFYQGFIIVKIRESGGWMHISVTDNGIGMSQEQISGIVSSFSSCVDGYATDPIHKSIGLENIYQRLKLEYGGRNQMEIKSREGYFTSISISFCYTALQYGS